MRDALTPPPRTGPSSESWPSSWAASGDALAAAHVDDQGEWTHYYNSGFHTLVNWEAAVAADGDSFTIPGVPLKAGTYTLRFGYRETASAGIIDIDLDGVEIASIDTYSATLAFDVEAETAGITVAADGIYDLRVRVDGRNAAANNFHCYVEFLGLVRTGA